MRTWQRPGRRFGAEGMDALATALGFRVEIRTPLKLRFDEEDREDRRAHERTRRGCSSFVAASAARGGHRSGRERQDPARDLGREATRGRRSPNAAHVLQPAPRRAPAPRPSTGSSASTSRTSTSCAFGWRRRPGSSCPRRTTSPGSPYFEHQLPEAARGGGRALGPRYDAIVVDEAQDFREWWWPALLSLHTDPDDGTAVRVRRRQPEPLRRRRCRSRPRTSSRRSPREPAQHPADPRVRLGLLSRRAAADRAEGPRGRRRSRSSTTATTTASRACSRSCSRTWSSEEHVPLEDIVVLTPRGSEKSVLRQRGSRRLPAVRDGRAGHGPGDERPRVQGPRATGGDPGRARRQASEDLEAVPVRRRVAGAEPPHRPGGRTGRAVSSGPYRGRSRGPVAPGHRAYAWSAMSPISATSGPTASRGRSTAR